MPRRRKSLNPDALELQISEVAPLPTKDLVKCIEQAMKPIPETGKPSLLIRVGG